MRYCKKHHRAFRLPYPQLLPCCFVKVPVITPAQLVAAVKRRA